MEGVLSGCKGAEQLCQYRAAYQRQVGEPAFGGPGRDSRFAGQRESKEQRRESQRQRPEIVGENEVATNELDGAAPQNVELPQSGDVAPFQHSQRHQAERQQTGG